MAKLFEREERYLVLKRKDLEGKNPVILAHLDHILRQLELPHRVFLVIESDWPEYEPTWAAIESRVTGAQPAKPDVGVLVEALEEIVKQYPSPDIGHLEYRLHACRHAESALATYKAGGTAS